ncbi:MAG: molybdenum ABC transporter ATP-binding protein [Azonexus sp.]|nr:molybdenum ABC transporter ATP-binding protein [Azonexus sp.]MCK6412439.1 molybdenum ABC transporter ATP-binding protein [Azonexus sp.]
MNPIRAIFHVDRGDFCLDVDLTLPGRGVSALFGHSGSGKTTILRAMAGLEHAPGGYLALGDTVWQDDAQGIFVPTFQRALGYVFQEANLFEHLSVEGNLEFGLRRIAAAERRFHLPDICEMLGIGGLRRRRPASLSGGERQRVAIARALLTAPRLLLMDEPLAALDLRRKQEILPYLERLHDELSIPIIYVSHSPDEVSRLADHLVLLDNGRLIASGPLQETLARADLPSSFADDAGVVIETMLAGHEADELTRLEFAEGRILVARRPEPVGQRLRCRIHARDVSLTLEKPVHSSILNIFQCTVSTVVATDTPGQVLIQLALGNRHLLARVTERSRRTLALQPGRPVWAQVKAVALLV